MHEIVYTIQIGYKNIIKPSTFHNSSSLSSSSPSATSPTRIAHIKPNAIRNTRLKALWLSLPKSFTGVVITLSTAGLIMIPMYWWNRLPLYEVDGQTIYFEPKKKSAIKKGGVKQKVKHNVEIKSNEFNPILDTLANEFDGIKLNNFTEDSFNFVQYQFKEMKMGGRVPSNAKTQSTQNAKAFISSLPQNVFVRYVFKTNHTTNETQILFPQSVNSIQTTILKFLDLNAKEKQLIESIMLNKSRYEQNNAIHFGMFKEKKPVEKMFPYLFLQ